MAELALHAPLVPSTGGVTGGQGAAAVADPTSQEITSRPLAESPNERDSSPAPAPIAQGSDAPVVALQPTGQGVRLQTDWSGRRIVISPEVTSQNQFSVGGALASTVSSRGAVGLLFTVGAEKREFVVNGGWQATPSSRLSLTLGQLRQQLTWPIESTTVAATVAQYAGGVGYALTASRGIVEGIDTHLYGSRSFSRAFAERQVFRSTGTEYAIFRVPVRIAGASVFGLASRVTIRPWASGRLGVTAGRERLEYDLYGGRERHDRIAASVEWSQRLFGPYALTAIADTRAGLHVYSMAVSHVSNRQQFGLSVTAVHGRDGGVRDTQFRWTHTLTFGSNRGWSRSAPPVDGLAPTGRQLLNLVSQRPSFMPPQVIARIDDTVPRRRLVAVAKSGPEGPDAQPDAFSFTAQTDVPVNTDVDSNTITVSGINTPAVITIVGGEYAMPSMAASYTPAAGSVSNGQTVTVRIHTSTQSSTTSTATLTIGGVAGTFSVTTEAADTTPGPDTTPDAFSFTAQTDVPVNTVIVSNTVTISGINTDTPITVSGGEYSTNGSSYTSSAGTVSNGDTLRLRQTSSGTFSTTTTMTVTVGGVSATFTVTTEAMDEDDEDDDDDDDEDDDDEDDDDEDDDEDDDDDDDDDD